MSKVFIVGSEGTTGLRLKERLGIRKDVELIEIKHELRKDKNEIKMLMELSDFVFLCLPDTAAIEMAELAIDTGARLVDASTAHRTDESWAYGLPELSASHRSAVEASAQVAVPGCHASGFIALAYPLISSGLLSYEAYLTCSSLTGYSGGGKSMIADYESPGRSEQFNSCKLYAMAQTHKHLPEIVKQCKLKNTPVFMPVVGDFYSGMLVTLPLNDSDFQKSISVESLRQVYKSHYNRSKMIKVSSDSAGSLYANTLSGRDDMEIFIDGSDGRYVACALFDNLGKGASGAAVQCFNIMSGLPEETGLVLG